MTARHRNESAITLSFSWKAAGIIAHVLSIQQSTTNTYHLSEQRQGIGSFRVWKRNQAWLTKFLESFKGSVDYGKWTVLRRKTAKAVGLYVVSCPTREGGRRPIAIRPRAPKYVCTNQKIPRSEHRWSSEPNSYCGKKKQWPSIRRQGDNFPMIC